MKKTIVRISSEERYNTTFIPMAVGKIMTMMPLFSSEDETVITFHDGTDCTLPGTAVDFYERPLAVGDEIFLYEEENVVSKTPVSEQELRQYAASQRNTTLFLLLSLTIIVAVVIGLIVYAISL